MLILQESRSVHDLRNRQKSHLLLKSIFYFVCQVSIFNVHITLLVFWIFKIILDITECWKQSKGQIPAFNVRQTEVNKHHYWMALTLVRPNSACVGEAKIDPFMKL